MASIVRNVADIEASDRRALEHLLGVPLSPDQRVSISLDRVEQSHAGHPCQVAPPWAKIYEGLSDEEIDRLDQAVRQRANLARAFE